MAPYFNLWCIFNNLAHLEQSLKSNMADFHVVDIAFDSEVKFPHKLFYKKHVGKDTDENTLFLMNIPPYCSEVCIFGLL